MVCSTHDIRIYNIGVRRTRVRLPRRIYHVCKTRAAVIPDVRIRNAVLIETFTAHWLHCPCAATSVYFASGQAVYAHMQLLNSRRRDFREYLSPLKKNRFRIYIRLFFRSIYECLHCYT